MSFARRKDWEWTAAMTAFAIMALLVLSGKCRAQAASEPLGQFITLDSPITDEAIGRVRRAALALQDEALREGRDGVLVLQITPGASQFHHVYALADFLTSPAVATLRTVAWIPESVRGDNVVVALACREIVQLPDSVLGHIGLGEAIPAEQRAIVLELVSRGGNRLVTKSLAEAMLDPQVELRQLTVVTDGVQEHRLATEQEAAQITASGATIPESRIIKERGVPGVFSGREARSGKFLTTRLADSRREVADLYGLSVESLREASPQATAERVSLIEIRGSIDTVAGSFLQRQIARAVEGGTELLIFEIHSPGGHLEEVHDLAVAIARLHENGVRTVAWVPEVATGESALLALGCDEIYVQPEARFGAVARRRDFRLDGSAESELNFIQDSLRELAELKHRPAAVLLAMADPKLEVFEARRRETGEVTFLSDSELELASQEWIRGPQVPEAGNGLLTVTGLRAQQLMIAEPPVESFEEVRQRLGLPDALRPQRIEQTWVDELIFVLNRPGVTGMLFALAMLGIYLELHFMTGALGLMSVTCLGLYFWSRFLGGTAGGLEIMLFLLGMGCVALELFVLPGFGLFGVVGGAMILASLVMASQTFGNIEVGRDLSEATATLKTISISIVSVILLAMVLNRFLPRIPF
ncbi:MAG: hypothetical protein KDA75_13455, partial [Planctomycetaceae bacterium]|nr:hypothetical protein [Planctomycetaceae bacterium]